MAGQFRQHSVTVLTGLLMLMAAALVDYATGPEISCGPLYLIPCAVLALVVGRAWGTFAAVACAVSVTIMREGFQHHFQGLLTPAMIWNLAMRFIFFEIFVLLLDRIRRDLSAQAATRNSSPAPDKNGHD
jgi:hypothetical protein